MRRTMVLSSMLAMTAAVTASTASAQDALPASLAGWTPGTVERFTCQQIDSLVGQDAAALREFGCRVVERREYRRGNDRITVAAYRMADSTGAYGAFTFRRTRDMKDSPVAKLAAAATNKVQAVAGDVYLEISGDGLDRIESDLRAVVEDVKSRTNPAPFPVLVEYLPDENRVPNSERFILGPTALARFAPLHQADWIGFDLGAEAQLAEYRRGGQEITLLLAQYPTPQVASAKLDALRRWFNVNAQEEVVSGRPVVFARRISSLVAIVPQAVPASVAEGLLDQVDYQTQVTMNEPGFKATDPTWGEMVVGIFYGTGILLLMALAGGLLFAGVRLIVKRVAPGKIFDRDSSVEILQLGLGSKPIEGKDFY
ncbi:MAG: DUF6599 family protein [Candidatus Acidiferrales bacterium]